MDKVSICHILVENHSSVNKTPAGPSFWSGFYLQITIIFPVLCFNGNPRCVEEGTVLFTNIILVGNH